MKLHRQPPRHTWSTLIQRPGSTLDGKRELVKAVLDDVRKRGDAALKEYTAQFDGWQPGDLRLSIELRDALAEQVAPPLVNSLKTAIDNIRKFHSAQAQAPLQLETMPGVLCSRRSVPIERVGLYIPGGSAPLFSTLLMLAIPAQLAGCKEIVVCTPATGGHLSAVLCKTLQMLYLDQVYCVGGAQAIAAMAYGTESIPPVLKIFGPGNSYVTLAKQLVAQEGVAIDLPAGPSEVAVVADHTAPAAFVAADLLAQAEHGPDSQVLLVTTDPTLPARLSEELEAQLAALPRAHIAKEALSHSHIVVLDTLEDAMAFVNMYAPEHLILQAENTEYLESLVSNAGSVFSGLWTPESVGDYASGTNHTLPTNGFAKAYSGVSLDSFVKKITFQKLSQNGLKSLGPAVEQLAAAEGLLAHKNAVTIRLQHIQ